MAILEIRATSLTLSNGRVVGNIKMRLVLWSIRVAGQSAWNPDRKATSWSGPPMYILRQTISRTPKPKPPFCLFCGGSMEDPNQHARCVPIDYRKP